MASPIPSTKEGWKHVRTLFRTGSLCGLTDEQLLDRFGIRNDEGDEADAAAAFEALVERHGPMVRRLCRSLTNDRHDADDAFQATFLVLARHAASIRHRGAVASWLCGVAFRVVARARAEAGRRRVLERVVAEQARREAIESQKGPAEAMPELYEEIARLPERYRAPIMLCYLRGHDHKEAARMLRCPLRTLETRLHRGKAKLRIRLLRRGLAPEAGLLPAGLVGGAHTTAMSAAALRSACDTLPPGLAESTARSALTFASARRAGLVSATQNLAQGVAKTLLWNRVRQTGGAAASILMVATVTLFGPAAAVQELAKPADTVTIRILDDRSRPISGADVWLQVRVFDKTNGRLTEWPTNHGTTDGQGRYRMPVPEGMRPAPEDRRFGLLVLVFAHARDRRIAMANAREALYRKAQSVDLTLGPLTDTEFLILGPDGKPVAGATVEPGGIKTPIGLTLDSPPEFLLPKLQAVTDADGRARLPALPSELFRYVQIATEPLGIQRLDLFGRPQGVTEREIRLRPAGRIFGRILADRPEWARGVKLSITTTLDSVGRHDIEGTVEVVSRPDGLFLIPAIASGTAMIGVTIDPAIRALPRVPQAEVQPGAVARIDIRLEKPVKVRGLVRASDTGNVVAGAKILIGHGARNKGEGGVSDLEGRFEVDTLSGDVTVQVLSGPDTLVQLGEDPLQKRYRVPAGIDTLDLPPIDVVHGVNVQGRLVDAANQPLANASVYADAASGNRLYDAVSTGPDGAFTMMVPSRIPLRYRYAFHQGGAPQGVEPVGEAAVVREKPLLLRASSQPRPQVGEDQPPTEP
jgi:RNA polymerase sigma factor (sigma-70 family)